MALIFILWALPLVHGPAPAHCRFQPVDQRWEGTCGPLFGHNPSLMLRPARSISTGVWRRGEPPVAVWAGEMTDSGYPSAAIEVEVHARGTGVIRTEFGWFPVSRFTRAGGTVRFDVDTSREVLPSEVDREIVQRAAALLSSTTTWNREDTRECAPTATTWSIYCALERATIEKAGAFHHRRPALEVVRTIVDERTTGRPYRHRLMEYNNDPSTRLQDVQSLFAEALRRIGR